MNHICKASHGFGRVSYSATTDGDGIDDRLEQDKKYGIFQPRNDKYFTFRVYNVLDAEITEKQVIRAVQYGFKRWSMYANITVRKAKPKERADFHIHFRTVESDERKELTRGTIMYHYFPINGLENINRGVCVVNSAYYYTSHGNGIPMNIIDPINYRFPTTITGATIDLDQVFAHEFGHGFGLPHDQEPGNVMSANYGVMNEYLTDRDAVRIQTKYGAKKKSRLARWLRWLKARSDRY